jgi:hypothetical protein
VSGASAHRPARQVNPSQQPAVPSQASPDSRQCGGSAQSVSPITGHSGAEPMSHFR